MAELRGRNVVGSARASGVSTDLLYGARVTLRAPGFAVAAILSVALGIGANTAIFSVAKALLWDPLPYPHPDRLVILWNRSPGLNITQDFFSTAQYFDIKDSQTAFEDVALAIGTNLTLTGDGEPERIGTISVSANLLPMLGGTAHVGRLFTPEDNATAPSPLQNQPPGRYGKVVLGHGTWLRRYGGDRGVIGRTLTLNGQPFQIIGVLPRSFSVSHEVLPTLGVVGDGELFLPLPLSAEDITIRTREDFNIIGRLKPSITVARAQAEMDVLTARLRQEHPTLYPPSGDLTFSVVPLLDQVVGNVRRPLLVLLASVGVVLLIACANVANLLLARALARQKEMAVRMALGAGRGRLVRQLLTESLLLSVVGGVLGVVLAVAGVYWLQVFQPVDVPRLRDIRIDSGVLSFSAVISIGSSVLFGLAPVVGLRPLDLLSRLKGGARESAGAGLIWRRAHATRRVLAVGELALAVVLLAGAGLLLRSFAHVQAVVPGFSPDHVVSFELMMTPRKYPNAVAVANGYRTLWERLNTLPGVTAAGGVTALPLSQFVAWGPITVEGRTLRSGETFINVDQRTAAARYFETMGIPLLRGRYFTEQDVRDQTRVVLVEEQMARTLWPGENPVGRRLRFGDLDSQAPWETVVGVVGDVKQYALDADSRMALYRPHPQAPSRSLFVVVRNDLDAAAATSAIVRAVRDFDSDLPVYRIRTMTQRVNESLARRRFSTMLLTLFAGVALVLAVIGTYGVMACLVRQGEREMGIRMALGAPPRAIFALVMKQGLVVSAAGVTLGLVGALALTRLMQTLLFGIDVADPLTFAIVGALLPLVAIAACYEPARRAARIDPLRCLRSE